MPLNLFHEEQPDTIVSALVGIFCRKTGSKVCHPAREKKSPQFFVHPPVLFLFHNFVSISDQNILVSVETCWTFTWVITPFKEWTDHKSNELNSKMKDRVEWKRLENTFHE